MMKRYMIYKRFTREMLNPLNQNYYYDEQQIQEEVDRMCESDPKMVNKIFIFAEDVENGGVVWA